MEWYVVVTLIFLNAQGIKMQTLMESPERYPSEAACNKNLANDTRDALLFFKESESCRAVPEGSQIEFRGQCRPAEQRV